MKSNPADNKDPTILSRMQATFLLLRFSSKNQHRNIVLAKKWLEGYYDVYDDEDGA